MNADHEDFKSQHWTLDKRVPLAIVLAMAGQLVIAGIWAGSMNQRMNELEEHQRQGRQVNERLARIEAILNNQQRSIQRIEKQMDGNR